MISPFLDIVSKYTLSNKKKWKKLHFSNGFFTKNYTFPMDFSPKITLFQCDLTYELT